MRLRWLSAEILDERFQQAFRVYICYSTAWTNPTGTLTAFPYGVPVDRLFERAFDNPQSGSEMRALGCGLLRGV